MTRLSAALLFSLASTLVLGLPAQAQNGPLARLGLQGFGATDLSYDPAIPEPAEVLGYEVGEWHVRHDQLVRYMEILAEASPRVSLEIQGHTHEQRPQILVAVTSEANQGRLEDIRRRHLQNLRGDGPEPSEEALAAQPAIVWLGYSIHGDEASGSNASLPLAYHLAAAQGREHEKLLEETIVLIDPSLNPDGLGRFAQWANGHRGRQPAGDPSHREHVQAWPGGRGNHYWFDLNRDWLLLQQPESRARMATYQRWRPHLSGDFHEMGSDRTYFFQPGVPLRANPLIPQENQQLTGRIARFHAAALDRAGELYYTEEGFDDFYPGKGSTYPDLTGGVGVLFEQGSSRGHRHETKNGLRTFQQAVANQLRTSLSMIEGARDQRRQLVGYRAAFARQARDLLRKEGTAGWVVSVDGDPARGRALVELLRRHEIRVHELGRTLLLEDQPFEAGTAYWVPAEQDAALLARSLFETRTTFADSTFYDVSAWNLALAFGARWQEIGLKGFDPRIEGALIEEPAAVAGRVPRQFSEQSLATSSAYAYLLSPSAHYLHRGLHRLLEAQIPVRLATRPFEAQVDDGILRPFPAGTPIVLRSRELRASQQPESLLWDVARKDAVDVWAVESGLTLVGLDLGSPSTEPLRLPKPVLVVGEGVNRYDAGEVWHLLDARFGIELPLVEMDRLGPLDLGRYTHLLLADGDYAKLAGKTAESLRQWVRQGGTLVASSRASGWVDQHVLADPGNEEEGAKETPKQQEEAPPGASNPEESPTSAPAEGEPSERGVSYGDFEKDRQAQRITGAIFQANLDLTHPLAFGYGREEIAFLRRSADPLSPARSPYEVVARYTAEPLAAGYASPENLEKLAGTPAVIATRLGRGVVVRFADNLNFRAYWHGTTKLYMNALYFSGAIGDTPPPAEW